MVSVSWSYGKICVNASLLVVYNAVFFAVVETELICEDRVTMVSRAEWRARPPREAPVNITVPVNMTFIHHSAGHWRGTNLTECIKQVQSIQSFHMDFRGKKLLYRENWSLTTFQRPDSTPSIGFCSVAFSPCTRPISTLATL